MVIAIFGGETYNSWGYRVEEVRETARTVFVRYSNIGYQTARGADLATPYAFVVIQKSNKLVVLEETTHTMQGTDVTREIARMPARKK